MQFKVPQNIDMQDRIIGPLTMVQFIYAVIGGGVCYAIFNVIPKPFCYIVIFPIALFVLAMIFLKVNERPFLNFLMSLTEFLATPKSRVWHHESSANLDVEIYRPATKQNVVIPTKQFTHEQLQEAARKIDTQ